MPLPVILEAIDGAPVRETLRIVDRGGLPVTTYTGNEPLTGECTLGDRAASLFAPTFTWNDATTGLVNISIAGSDTADLPDGDYPIFLTIGGSPPSGPVKVALLRLSSGPGDEAVLTTYCSYDDMRDQAGELVGNLDETSDQAGFAEQRHEARIWTERHVLSRAAALFNRWAIGYIDIGQNWTDALNAARDSLADTTDPDSVKEAFLATIRGYLVDDPITGLNQLQTTEADDAAIVEANAMYALYLIYDRQLGMVDGKKANEGGMSYRDLAGDWRMRAIRKLSATPFRIDKLGNGSTILRLEP